MIPAGGAGTRLWPLSRRLHPKHTLVVPGSGHSLIQGTHERLRPLVDELWVVTEAAQADSIRAALPQLPAARLLVEPEPRGTTSALGLAALTIAAEDADAIMVSNAADQVVEGDGYAVAIQAASETAAGGHLVTIGLRPTRPATGYGYIKPGGELPGGARVVQAFVEKPDVERATRLVAEEALWNLSMFCWRVSDFADELERVAPRHFAGLQRVLALRARGEHEEAAREYSTLPTDAIDYALLEKTARLAVIPASFSWSDVGSWSEWFALMEHDGQNNATVAEHVLIDTSSCLVSAPNGKLVATIGLENVVVVDAGDALLICPMDRVQEVKSVVERLGAKGAINYL